MQIYVDADACPVKQILVRIAKDRTLPVTMLIDTAHELYDGYSTIITVEKGADSVDIALINLAQRGDIVVTQDFGVAAMALSKGAVALNQNGLVYTSENIDRLLFERHVGKAVRRGGGKTTGPRKRTADDDACFEAALRGLIEQQSQNL